MIREVRGHGHSKWTYGDFVIDRKPGSMFGLSASRYCYELSYHGKKLKIFEYQKEAKHHVGEIVEAHRALMARRQKEERLFVEKYRLPLFPKLLRK